MAISVSLSKLLDHLDLMIDESQVFLNRKTGEVVLLTDEDLQAAEDGEDPEGYPEWQRDEIRKAKEVADSEDYLALPNKFDLDEYRTMQDFCYSIADAKVREDLCRAIQGSGAFRRFKERIHRHGVQQQWYAYRDQALKEEIEGWCEANGIALTP